MRNRLCCIKWRWLLIDLQVWIKGVDRRYISAEIKLFHHDLLAATPSSSTRALQGGVHPTTSMASEMSFF